MLVAFSAELASPKGKTTFSPWKHHPVWNKDHWTILQVFPVFFRSTAEISDCNVQTKRYLKFLPRLNVFPHFLNLQLGEGKYKLRFEEWRGAHVFAHCLFFQRWLFLSSEQRLLRATRVSPQIRGTDSVAVYTWVITSRLYDTACTFTGNLLLSKHHHNTQGYPLTYTHSVAWMLLMNCNFFLRLYCISAFEADHGGSPWSF